jgi:hypothetical protein
MAAPLWHVGVAVCIVVQHLPVATVLVALRWVLVLLLVVVVAVPDAVLVVVERRALRHRAEETP